MPRRLLRVVGRRRCAPGADAQAVLSHELNKLRFAALRRTFAAALPAREGDHGAPLTPGAETFPQAMARHRSQTGKGAMSWVSARPSAPALTIAPAACRLALRRALGVEASFAPPGQRGRCPFPSCRAPAAHDERHARHCRAMGYTYVHDRVRDTLASILTGYGVRHHVEDPTPFHTRRADRRMDVTTRPGALPLSGHRDLQRLGALLDVTVVDPLTHLRFHAATRDGAAADRAHRRKLQTYSGSYDHSSYKLWPLALESYGRWGDAAEEFIDALASHVVGGADSVSWRAKGVVVHGIRQRLAVTVQRAVSEHVLYYSHRLLTRAHAGDAALASAAV
jgi:hypothetical protein